MAPIERPTRLQPGVPHPIRPGNKVTSSVKVTALPQSDGQPIYFTLEPLIPLVNLPPTGDFTPGRGVINIRLSKSEDMSTPPINDPNPPVSDPPVTLSITIIPADVQRAAEKGIQYFQVGYHSKGQWHVMLNNIPTDAKEVTVPLAKLGDPPIAISP